MAEPGREGHSGPCSVLAQTRSLRHAAFVSLSPSVGFLLLQKPPEITQFFLTFCPSNMLFLTPPLHLRVSSLSIYLFCSATLLFIFYHNCFAIAQFLVRSHTNPVGEETGKHF